MKDDLEEIKGEAGASMVPNGEGGYRAKLPDKVDWLVAGHAVKSTEKSMPKYEVVDDWKESLIGLDEKVKSRYGPSKTFSSYELLWKFLSTTEALFTVVPSRAEKLGATSKAGIKELLRGYYQETPEKVLDEAAYIISKARLLKVVKGTVMVEEFLEG